MRTDIQISKPFEKWFKTPKRLKISFGGRGGGKTLSCIIMLIILSFKKENRNMVFLIARETMASIEDSSYSVLVDYINTYNLEKYFEITKTYIINKTTQVKFRFAGVRKYGISRLKSIHNIKYCYIDEAEDLSLISWMALEPSVRSANSEIWLTFNPRFITDFSYSLIKQYDLKLIDFKTKDKDYKYFEYEDDDVIITKVNYYSNSFYNEVLEKSRLLCQKNMPEIYNHLWLGELKTESGRIFGKQQLQYYDYEEYKKNIEPYYTKKAIIDPAFGRENCFTSCVIYSQVGDKFYIIDSGLMRTDTNTTTDEAIVKFLKSYEIREVMCEANFHQKELVKRLKRYFEVQPFYQKVNKIERIVDNAINIRERILFDNAGLIMPKNYSIDMMLENREGRNYIGMMQLFNFSDIASENNIRNDDFSYIDFVDVITSLVIFSKKRYTKAVGDASFKESAQVSERAMIRNRISQNKRKAGAYFGNS